ncbi:hypothetical protein RUM43_001887 [Polyplax serrata]|uniref:Uncharacterized protein n=1 Tax=Polyplax serrata TaxID=468196 RepID=A0AAN8SIN9_POLSC
MADRYRLVKVVWFTRWVALNASQESEDIKNRYKSKEDKLISFHVGRNTHKSEIKDVTRLHPSRVMKKAEGDGAEEYEKTSLFGVEPFRFGSAAAPPGRRGGGLIALPPSIKRCILLGN